MDDPNKELDLHRKASYLPDIHRLLPQAPDAERGVLSSFMLAPSQIGGICVEKGISEDHFHIPAHATIYELLRELYLANEPIDFITVTQILRDRGQLDRVGGAAFITELFTFLPTAANAGYYIEILQEKFTLRGIVMVCTEYAARAYDEQDDVAGLLAKAQGAIMALSREKQVENVPFQTVVMEAVQSIENGDEAKADVLSGIHTLDSIVKMRNGNLIVIGGAAKRGKTTLGGTIVANAAVHQRKRVAVFGLEMMNIEMAKRLIATEGYVNVSAIGNDPTPEEFDRVVKAATSLIHSDIEAIDDISDWQSLATRARKLHLKRPLNLIMVDYLQLIEWAGEKSRNDTEEAVINKVGRGCKNLATELGCVIIALSQLNENGSLRGSRSIGMHANAVIAVEEPESGGRVIRVVGQRNGQSNQVAPALWLPQFTRFDNLPSEPVQEQPELVHIGKQTKPRKRN